ncbi:hypothetical protein ACVFYP_25275 [Roseomonas sp. F4]|uniref:Uncharacterized protein n=1 Tax=Falsiroseomonas oleicola TaxID=2801474 RepID=A0ABS6HFX6_9PROT|nr:hypothetical protein [Roseomonas oleicola]MBU8547221.1 hypothetical protein [Roseomonas oleicola]
MNDDTSPDALRIRAQKRRSRAILAVLFTLVAVFFAITIARMDEQAEARKARATEQR